MGHHLEVQRLRNMPLIKTLGGGEKFQPPIPSRAILLY
jgi:hypothetical protein